MPVAALATLPGAGTFSTAVVPPTGNNVNVSASLQVNVSPAAQGYVLAEVTDLISGNQQALVGCLITDADRLAGFKNIVIGYSKVYPSVASLKINVNAQDLTGAVAAALVTGASLNSFLAA